MTTPTPKEPPMPETPTAEDTVTERVEWFCRDADGGENAMPSEAYARAHVRDRGCALIRKVIRTEVVAEEAAR